MSDKHLFNYFKEDIEVLKEIQQYAKDSGVAVITASQKPFSIELLENPNIISFREAIRRIKSRKLQNKLKKIKHGNK